MQGSFLAKIPAMLHVVLLEPEIPQNTGNIARTCAATGAKLHLIKPLGFDLDDKHMKRAGLDYWDALEVQVYENLAEFYEKNPDAQIYYFSKKGKRLYSEIAYPEDVYFMFGRESVGLPEDLLREHLENTIRLPMKQGLRSLNLSNAVAIAVYEALRQGEFKGLQIESDFQ